MARYQVSLVEHPQDWTPAAPDEVPPSPGKLLEILGDDADLFPALRQAIEYNKAAQEQRTGFWAVVVEPGSLGKTWRTARLCSPVRYNVTAIFWPQGWEPQSPFDVPHCVWRAQGDVGRQNLTYRRALATVRGLNQQSLANAGSMWYVIVAVENEPISHTVSYDAAGAETTVEVRRLHVVRPEPGGRGDCSHCPAHSFECAKEDATNLVETITSTHSPGVE
jgi:hypothetical protein